MAVGHGWFSRKGSGATGGMPTAPLQARITHGFYSTSHAFDQYVEHLRLARSRPWTVALHQQTIAHAQWMSLMSWQLAQSFLQGSLETQPASTDVPPSVYQQCDALCDRADQWTLHAVRLQSEYDHGVRPPLASLVDMPTLDVHQYGPVAVWTVFHAIYSQTYTDKYRVESLGIPRRMSDVHQRLKVSLEPEAAVFGHLEAEWAVSTNHAHRLEIINKAAPAAKALFTLGQQLWAPYLLGDIYATALRRKPTLEDLELGFDPWVLTDPAEVAQRKQDVRSVSDLLGLWQSFANPGAAYKLQQQLQQAFQARRIRYRTSRAYRHAPWQAQYMVRFPVSFGKRTFTTGDLIALFVAEDGNGKYSLEVRKTGRLVSVLDLLGQARMR